MVKMFKYVLLAFLPILIACSKEEPAQDIIIDFSGNNNVLNEIVKAVQAFCVQHTGGGRDGQFIFAGIGLQQVFHHS